MTQLRKTHICDQPAPRLGKPGGQRVGKRVGDVFYPAWRAGSKLWRLAQNKAYYGVLAVQVSFHFAWHFSISAAPKFLVFGNFAEFHRLVGPHADLGGGGGGGYAPAGDGLTQAAPRRCSGPTQPALQRWHYPARSKPPTASSCMRAGLRRALAIAKAHCATLWRWCFLALQ